MVPSTEYRLNEFLRKKPEPHTFVFLYVYEYDVYVCGIFICVCVCVVYMYMCACAYIYMQRLEKDTECPALLTPPYSFETGSLWQIEHISPISV